MLRSFTSIFSVLILPLAVICQDHAYVQYINKQGLAGAVVYCMAQDKDGFMWFATETGLSRFDGTQFTNFHKEDGLPANEVLQVFGDSRGRLWISPFQNAVCYYFNGKIYNQHNNALLKCLKVKEYVVRYAEDAVGNILLQETSRLHLIKTGGQVISYDSILGKPIQYISTIGRSANGRFWVMEGGMVFELGDDGFVLKKKLFVFSMHFLSAVFCGESLIRTIDTTVAVGTSLLTGKTVQFPDLMGLVNLVSIDSTQIAICTRQGAKVCSSTDGKILHSFMPDFPVTSVMKDREGNFWFSTIGQGVYRLASMFVWNYRFGKDKSPGPVQPIFCFGRYKGSILLGCDRNIVYRVNAQTGHMEKKLVFPDVGVDPLRFIYPLKDDALIFGTGHNLLRVSPQYGYEAKIDYIYVKMIDSYRNNLVVATSKHVLIIDPKTLTILDTIWKERATAVLVDNDTIYIGGLKGLHIRRPDGSITYAGEKIPELRSRIASICKDRNNILWLITYDDGLFAYKNGRIMAAINKKNGLTSNTCRAVFLKDDDLWLATDNGLNKIDLGTPGYPVRKYTSGDGLGSDLINAVYAEGNNVFIGTTEGMTLFDQQKMDQRPGCNLVLTGVFIAGNRQSPDSSIMRIPHAQNNIRFEYVGISFKSSGDIRYRYRLLGLDNEWKETRETFLSYPTLPSGDYELQLQAINKFDVYSKIISAKFTIEKLWWEKTFFQLLAGFIFLGLTGLLVWGIIYRIHKREREKATLGRRIIELEQLARKAQMNPHFIFNSLNSIQQYVMDADLAGANKFISGFSMLIRQTLDFSSRQEISLEEEVGYLTNYLDLERTRLEDAFSWSVEVADDITPAEYYLPPMVLQPFVENSVRHGLRLRKDKDGKLAVTIKKDNNYLICVVEDNGVGRKAAQLFKSNSHIEYQSKGMSLTAERIAILNMDYPGKITMEIEDLEDDAHHALGTRVTISFRF